MEDLLEDRLLVVPIDEQIIFNQLEEDANAIWSLLLATGFEFKVFDPDENEAALEDTLVSAHRQIEEKQYEAELIAQGFASRQIRKYGFAFRGKECLIG